MAALGGVYRNPAGAVRGWEAAAAAGFGSPEVPKLKCYRSAEELGGEGEARIFGKGSVPRVGLVDFIVLAAWGASRSSGCWQRERLLLPGILVGIRCLDGPSLRICRGSSAPGFGSRGWDC